MVSNMIGINMRAIKKFQYSINTCMTMLLPNELFGLNIEMYD